jgi:hypothetical protein
MRCVMEDLGMSIMSNQKGSTATFSMLNAASARPADVATVARAAARVPAGKTTGGRRRCAGAENARSPSRGRIGSVGEGPRGADSAGAKAGRSALGPAIILQA